MKTRTVFTALAPYAGAIAALAIAFGLLVLVAQKTSAALTFEQQMEHRDPAVK